MFFLAVGYTYMVEFLSIHPILLPLQILCYIFLARLAYSKNSSDLETFVPSHTTTKSAQTPGATVMTELAGESTQTNDQLSEKVGTWVLDGID